MGDCKISEYMMGEGSLLVFNLIGKCQTGCSPDCENLLQKAHQHPCLDKSIVFLTESYLRKAVDKYYAETMENSTVLEGRSAKIVSLLYVCDKVTYSRPSGQGGDQFKASHKCGNISSAERASSIFTTWVLPLIALPYSILYGTPF